MIVHVIIVGVALESSQRCRIIIDTPMAKAEQLGSIHKDELMELPNLSDRPGFPPVECGTTLHPQLV